MRDGLIIATILPEHGHTGVQSHFNALRTYLDGIGVSSSVVSAYGFVPFLAWPLFATRRPIEQVNRPASVWWYEQTHYLALRAALRTRLATGEPVLVYAQCPLAAQAALEARSGPHQRVIMAVHFNVSQAEEWVEKALLEPAHAYYRAIVARERDILPRLDGIVHTSRFMRDLLQERIPGLESVPSLVVPNFVYRPEPVPERCLSSNRLITIGSLEPRKNQTFLLHVLAEAKSRGKEYHLTIVGDGQDRATLVQLSRDLAIDDLTTFVGFRAKASSLLPGHAAYVHAAHVENLPVALVESLAYGLPIFAAPVGGIPEVFVDGEQGRFWSLDSPSEAATILIETFGDPGLMQRMAASAQQRFSDVFDPSQTARKLVAFLSGDQLDADAARVVDAVEQHVG